MSQQRLEYFSAPGFLIWAPRFGAATQNAGPLPGFNLIWILAPPAQLNWLISSISVQQAQTGSSPFTTFKTRNKIFKNDSKVNRKPVKQSWGVCGLVGSILSK